MGLPTNWILRAVLWKMRKGERVGSGTAQLTKTFIAASHERKSLPTQVQRNRSVRVLPKSNVLPWLCVWRFQVHVRPSNINCNSLRSDFSLTKFNPTILIGFVRLHSKMTCRTWPLEPTQTRTRAHTHLTGPGQGLSGIFSCWHAFVLPNALSLPHSTYAV